MSFNPLDWQPLPQSPAALAAQAGGPGPVPFEFNGLPRNGMAIPQEFAG